MKYALVIASLVVLGAGCAKTPPKITNFEECVAAGNPVMESLPRQCRAAGVSYVETREPPVTESAPRPENAELGEAFTLKTGQARGVDGGLRVTLLEISDSRCKPGMQCIWAGELSVRLKVEGPEDTAPQQELQLGTARSTTGLVSGFRFALQGANEASATLLITK